MKIAPSILDCRDRVDGVVQLNKTNISYIHIDVMDGRFVSDTQFYTIKEIRDIDLVSKYPLDVHLMVEDPIEYVEQLSDMNIEFVTFHLEVKQDIREIISKIKGKGYKVGISIKPSTDIQRIVPYLKDIDLVLVMSVEPGLGGQKFLLFTIHRVNELKRVIVENDYHVLIEVDGGINDEVIAQLENVDIAVVGSYITKSDDYDKQVERLLSQVKR